MRRSMLSISVFILTLTAAGAFATQVLYQSVEELGRNSSAVVTGTVTGVRSYWNEAHTKIFTETTVAVEESFKGRPGSTVAVVQLGGTVGDIRVTAHGALQWKPGEEIALFLEPLDAGRYQVAGFSQGKFQIDRDPDTGEAFIMRPALSGVELVGMPMDKSSGAAVERIPLSTFMQKAMGEETSIKKN